MTFHQINCFLCVTAQKSFIAAAKQLYTTQPVITYQINSLEKELNVVLFNRTNKGVELTPIGEEFYKDALQIYESYETMLAKMKALSTNGKPTLTIGIRKLTDYGTLATTIRSFNECSEYVRADIMSLSEYAPLEPLLNGQADFVFLYDNEYTNANTIEFLPLIKMANYVLLDENHPLAVHEELSLDELLNQQVILPQDDEQLVNLVPTVTDLRDNGLIPNRCASSFEGIFIKVAAGLGISFIHCDPKKNFIGIRKVKLKNYHGTDLGIAWLKRRFNPDMEKYIKIVKESYGIK